MKKTLTALAIAGSLTFLGASAAQAVPYPAPPVAEVSDSTVTPGETFVFSGEGFIPGETIIITITLETEPTASGVGGLGLGGGLGAGVTGVIVPSTVVDGHTVTADENGAFATEVALSEPGTYALTAEGQESGVVQSATVEVVAVDGAAVPGDDNSNNGTGTDVGDDDSNNGIGAGVGGDSAANDEAVANGDRLADTGLDSSALLWGGAGVLALGAGATAVVVSRRKSA